jgi:hypothetical protein
MLGHNHLAIVFEDHVRILPMRWRYWYTPESRIDVGFPELQIGAHRFMHRAHALKEHIKVLVAQLLAREGGCVAT